MIRLKIGLTLVLAMCIAIATKASVVTLKIKNPQKDEKATLIYDANGEKEEMTFDYAGIGRIEIFDLYPQYATLVYKKTTRTIYIDSKQDLTVFIDGNTPEGIISFEGKNAEINTYLNSGKIKTLPYDAYADKEKEYIKKVDNLYESNLMVLDSAKLPNRFNVVEKGRLLYLTYSTLPEYPANHRHITKDANYKKSTAFNNKLKSLTTIDATLLQLKEYKTFLLRTMISLSPTSKDKSPLNNTISCIKYIDKTIKDPKIVEFLVDKLVTEQIDFNGLSDTEELLTLYRKNVINPDLTFRLEKLCHEWKEIGIGHPSPTFTCSDIDGYTVSLKDFRGKFVYIDIWATWCWPCRKEIPYLENLEEKYAGNDICFISISCDKDKLAWKSLVKKNKMTGIQLHFGNDSSFMTAYDIHVIPRFILLDRNGKIINMNATRPSDEITTKTFDRLLGL